jgi:hypothetical protein
VVSPGDLLEHVLDMPAVDLEPHEHVLSQDDNRGRVLAWPKERQQFLHRLRVSDVPDLKGDISIVQEALGIEAVWAVGLGIEDDLLLVVSGRRIRWDFGGHGSLLVNCFVALSPIYNCRE